MSFWLITDYRAFKTIPISLRHFHSYFNKYSAFETRESLDVRRQPPARLAKVMLECYLQAADIVAWSRSKSCLLRLSSPERARLQELQESILASESVSQACTIAPPPLGSSSPSKENLVLYVPEVEEIRISPVIARKGYLNVLEHKTNGWKKRWVVRSANSRVLV